MDNPKGGEIEENTEVSLYPRRPGICHDFGGLGHHLESTLRR